MALKGRYGRTGLEPCREKLGSVDDLEVVEIPAGEPYRITEYDGMESVSIPSDLKFVRPMDDVPGRVPGDAFSLLMSVYREDAEEGASSV